MHIAVQLTYICAPNSFNKVLANDNQIDQLKDRFEISIIIIIIIIIILNLRD